MSDVKYKEFVEEFVERLYSTGDLYLEKFDEHFAFDYLVAEIFETVHPEKFTFTDGKKDGKIDFFVKEQSSYSIYQCKCPDLEKISDGPHSFDTEVVSELEMAIQFMTDNAGNWDVKKEVQQLRADYQRELASDENANVSLSATLAILGELTPAAIKAFNALREKHKNEIRFKLITWKDLHKRFHAIDTPEKSDIRIGLRFDEDNLLSRNDFCYIICHAIDLVDAFEKYEWSLFDWNVRFQIPNSSVNKKIMHSLTKAKTRKKFHHYNNGLLITCKECHPTNEKEKRLMVTGPQIINGCQTVRALVEAYREMPPQDQKEFREQTRVQVKIIKTIESDYIGELVITTNDQNPMNPRNLKSNSSEQRDIQKQFRLQLQKKWFYIRKDGEFASLINTNQKTNWFKPHEYSYDKRKYRVIDNEKLAKYWYSFIGFSDETNKGGVAYFKEEENGPYNYIFKKRPTEKFWQEYQNPFFKADDACFEPGTPSIYQYLLAFGVGEYVEKRKISPSKNKQEAIERGLAAKTIKDKTDKKQIDIWLDQDQEYRINHLISNMKDVFLELYGFVFTLKYGRVDTEVSKKIINIGTFQEYLDAGCDHSLVSMNQDGASILGPTYEALKFFIKQYYFENNSEIRVAPRIKMYLSSRNTINKMKVLIIKKNNEISDFMADWKLQGKSFLESLPKI